MIKLFSVIIAAYNREKYIRETIDSVLNQSFTNYELIIVDDGSTDKTWEIIQSYGNKIISLCQSNQGSEATFRKGASLASGEYLAFLDSDDLFLPRALSVYNKIIRTFNSPPIIMGALKRFMDGEDVQMDEGDKIEVFKYRDYLSKEIPMGLAQSIIVMRRTVFEEVNNSINSLGEYLFNYDYNLMLQTGTHGPCIIVKSPITVAYRQHKKQNSLNVNKMSQGVLSLIKMVRQRRCFGGRKRTFDKYAYLGGPIAEWTRKSVQTQKPILAYTLLINGWPMLVAAAVRKLLIRFNRSASVVIPIE